MTYDEFHKWVHKEIGINLTAYKPDQLNRRIESLRVKIGVKSLEEYAKLIKKDDKQRQKFLDFITINVTEFYRNPELFKQLEILIKDKVLPNNKKIKVWSAACSIGCEAYSVAMILDRITSRDRYSILATDIDTKILSKAKEGKYQSLEMKNVGKLDQQKYFTKVGNVYKISDDIISKVTYKKHDLILDRYEKDFDLILCRNVVIYFKNETKDEIYKKFNQALKPGGLLFVGATESINNYRELGFEKISTFIYRKK